MNAACDWLWEYYWWGEQPSDEYFGHRLVHHLSSIGSPSTNQVRAIQERVGTLKLALNGWRSAEQVAKELACYFAGG